MDLNKIILIIGMLLILSTFWFMFSHPVVATSVMIVGGIIGCIGGIRDR